jgi:hypothetical protein
LNHRIDRVKSFTILAKPQLSVSALAEANELRPAIIFSTGNHKLLAGLSALILVLKRNSGTKMNAKKLLRSLK